MISTVETLKRARARIATPEHWTQEDYARDKHGVALPVGRLHLGEQFCALGALFADGMAVGQAEGALEDVLPKGFYDVPAYNDAPRRTHAQILRLYDKAIAKLEKRNA